jgi:hypothetical protein
LTYDHTTNVDSATTVRCDFIFWDWKEQPDFKEVEASVHSMLSNGAARINLTMANTSDDSYCLVVSDSHLSPGEALRAYEDWQETISPDNPGPADPAPYVWRRR